MVCYLESVSSSLQLSEAPVLFLLIDNPTYPIAVVFRCTIKTMLSIPAEDLQYYIDHIFLPPKLPQQAEDGEHARSAEQRLLRLLYDSTISFQSSQTSVESTTGAWEIIDRMIECWITLDSTPILAKPALLTALAGIKHIGKSTYV